MTESEKEKKIFLSYCGSRDQELLMGRKKMTLGDMERKLWNKSMERVWR